MIYPPDRRSLSRTGSERPSSRPAVEGFSINRDEQPSEVFTPRRIALLALILAATLGGLYFLLPKLAGLNQTWGQLRRGDPLWLALGVVLEAMSLGGYVALFGTVFGRGMARIDWRASIEIPLAGIAAIRLLAAAGAGGVAVTAWALRHAGMSSRVIACRMVASYAIQYGIYLAALVVCGLGLWTGALNGGGSIALTLIPAILSAAVIALVASMGLVPGDFERRLARLAHRAGRIGRLAARLATVPATLGIGVRTAIDLIRERRPGLLGAVAYWAFDIAVLGVSLRAFGSVVPVPVVVMSYFLGTLGSLLPLPGGIGGVEGGMIGALAAFGVPGGRAVVAVLAYRAISFWLPTLPGIAGYLALHARVRSWRAADTQTVRVREEQRGQPQAQPNGHADRSAGARDPRPQI
jgi:uncharacterized protein (TIRG00374 family)